MPSTSSQLPRFPGDPRGRITNTRADVIVHLTAAVLCLLLPSAVQAAADLDRLSWGSLPATMQVGQLVPVQITARTLAGDPATNYNGAVSLTEWVATNSAGVRIAEVESVATQRVEFANLSTNAIDVSGWRVVVYDGVSWPLPKATVTLPPGTVCPGGTVFEILGGGPAPGAYPLYRAGADLAWTGAERPLPGPAGFGN